MKKIIELKTYSLQLINLVELEKYDCPTVWQSGEVNVDQYKISIEKIEEPDFVIKARMIILFNADHLTFDMKDSISKTYIARFNHPIQKSDIHLISNHGKSFQFRDMSTCTDFILDEDGILVYQYYH